MDLVLDIAGNQIDGARDYQEDAFLITYLGDDEGGDSKSSALVVMADGMGGHAAGNIASNLVVQTFNRTFTGKFGKEAPSEILHECLIKANAALAEAIKETPALDGMGCTMVTACFSKGKVFWVSVGDSHMYVIRSKQLLKKNADHSYGGYLDRMREQGVDIEPEPGLSRNMLMSAMTGEEIAEIDCPEEGFELEPGDRVVISSDGLDTLTPGTLLQTSAWSPTAKECVAGMLQAVEDANKPRQDNTTVIVVDVAEKAREPVPEPPPPPPPPPSAAVEATVPGAAAPAEPAPAPEAEPVEEKKRGLGVLVIAAVVVLAAIGAGGYFFLGGKKPPPPAPVATTQPSAQPAAKPAAPVAPASPAAPEQKKAAEAAAPAPAQPAAKPAVAAAAPAAPAAEQKKPAAAAPAAAPAAPAPSKVFRDKLASGGEGPAMVRLPGGTFKMGSAAYSVEADERPQHTVHVKPFAMGEYEVTFAQYDAFAKATGRKQPNNNYMDKKTHPVVNVTWDDAYAYTQWLSKETGHKYRLPSEAEWEYAARAGTTTPYWWGFDVGQNRAHCFDCKTGLNPRQPTVIGHFKPNPFGLYDTSGNVSEWVYDCYHPDYKGAPTDGSVWEGGDCSYRIARGGSFSDTSKQLRTASRQKWRSTQGQDSIGFRVARDLGE